MRKLVSLLLLAFVASCGTEPGFVPRRGDPDPRSEDAFLGRCPDWGDGLSLEELLACVESRGAVLAARENAERAQSRKDETRTFRLLPFEVSGVRPSRRYDKTASGATVRHIYDDENRWEKRQATFSAEIAQARSETNELLERMRDRARRAYWAAVAADGRVAIGREEVLALSRVAAPDRLSASDAAVALSASDRARDEVRQAERRAQGARAEIAEMIGDGIPSSWTLSDSFPEDRPEVDLEVAIALARANRARLATLAASASEAQCRLEAVEAESGADPGFGVSYLVERDVKSVGLDFRDSESTAFAGIVITLPVRSHARRLIAAATSESRAALEARSSAEAEIAPEITEAVRRYRDACTRVARLEAEYPVAPDPGLLPGWLRAEAVFVSAERAVNDARLELAVARSRLEAAVGRPVSEQVSASNQRGPMLSGQPAK